MEGLRANSSDAYEQVPKQLFMKWEQSARRYIDTYRPRSGTVLNFAQAQWAHKK
jgi:hypothetical protein